MYSRLYSKPLETPMVRCFANTYFVVQFSASNIYFYFCLKISEDEGFVEVSDESEPSTIPTLSDDTGIQNLEVWDEALKQKPPCFYTWEGRKQM